MSFARRVVLRRMTNQILPGKTAIIYGAGGTLGSAVASTFAREGASVFLAGRTLEPLERVAAEITAAGGRAATAMVDATDERAVDEHAAAVAAETATFLASDRAGAITSGIVNATCGLVPG
jgi:NADP-dependent 3-hydroxy acid dehydrogenase YdfG